MDEALSPLPCSSEVCAGVTHPVFVMIGTFRQYLVFELLCENNTVFQFLSFQESPVAYERIAHST